MNYSTLLNTTSTYAGCTINWETVRVTWFATDFLTSLASFVGNILLITVVYRTTIRTSADYFVVNIAASDMFLPLYYFVGDIVLKRKDSGYLSQTIGTVLCKFFYFFSNISYGVSINPITVITVYRFYAVVFPMRARVQSRRTCIIFLLLTWVLPIAVSSPSPFWFNFNLENQNTNCSQGVVRRRRKRNFRLTTMFISVTVAFILCWGVNRVMYLFSLFSLVTDWCTFFKVNCVVAIFPRLVFHSINPVVYFIFCSSYRQGMKQLLPL